MDGPWPSSLYNILVKNRTFENVRVRTKILQLSPTLSKFIEREWGDVNNHSLRAFVHTLGTSDTILKNTICVYLLLEKK